MLTDRYVTGIATHRELLHQNEHVSSKFATTVSPLFGYEAAAGVAGEALTSGAGTAQIALSPGLLSPPKRDALVVPRDRRGSCGLAPKATYP